MTTSQDLNDPRNGTTLSEMKFKPNENIGAFRKRVDLLRKAPIVEDKDGQVKLTPLAILISKEIFEQFADVEGRMSEVACSKFQKAWIGTGVKGALVNN